MIISKITYMGVLIALLISSTIFSSVKIFSEEKQSTVTTKYTLLEDLSKE